MMQLGQGPASDCARLRPLISDYIDNNVDENTRSELEAHIVVCLNCPTLFKAMFFTFKALQEFDAGTQVPAEVSTRMREKLRQALKDLLLPS